ncbi:5-deoxy-glucuronate isomerase [Neobacillus sedimentimangrovi]|jgi:5-deoxy-glucuronate isomerase|uniref:5-deoxy-glucuronate isomerase n=1 Tax=Neobacillus sedimentimangrovi TaxID=2699460 RepID=A0ABS8QE80_9BACI|nr:5-deoxy-glucuronate isomerase [Neobacillus sedimentimangrovi]AIM16967.1 5-deoxyglucuronate isomerase [Bacillus sp. X1(2014)]MCD4837557.1 5-deoxy-glucuronate isomerase [Neobacillus sedimentimangrovi]
MYEKLGELKEGYTAITDMDNKHPDMLQDIGIYTLAEGKEEVLFDEGKESAILLLEGSVRLGWNGHIQEIKRKSVFEEDPWCLHVPKGVEVKLTALAKSEVLVQKTNNEKEFEAKLYTPEDCESSVLGEGVWNGTAERVIRTIFDYNNAPYSNLVIGEVISYPGRWSSYPPHHHDQPEVYYYRFDKPQGFGCAMVGEEAYRVEHNSYITIPGNLDHPQATAPGYAMYFCWMIRHLDQNPWTDRIMEEEHKWLLEPDAKIWPEK